MPLYNPIQPVKHPGFIVGRSYPTVESPTTSAAAYGGTLETQMALYPFYIPQAVTVSALQSRVATGVALSFAKHGVWAHSYVTGRPTGLALTPISTNTAYDYTVSSTNIGVSGVSHTFTPNWYWVGFAATAAAPNTWCITGGNGAGHWPTYLLGRTNIGANTINAVSTGFVYASDSILTKDLTGATFSDLGGVSGQLPVFNFLVA